MTRRILLSLVALSMVAASCGDDSEPDVTPTTSEAHGDGTPDEPDRPTIEIDEEAGDVLANSVEGLPQLAFLTVVDGLKGPVDMKQAPGDDRFFVFQVRDGTIVIVDDGEILDTPFLDISEWLAASSEGEERGRGERGLLSLAFHPD
jgi:hypothetical protein